MTIDEYERGQYGTEVIIYEGETKEEAIKRSNAEMEELLKRNAQKYKTEK